MSDLQLLDYQGSDGWPLHAWILADGGEGESPVVLLHGGGPDHRSMEPLGRRLGERRTIVLPDIRGYGRSVCADPARHTWKQYAADVVSLLDCVGADRGVLVGAGIGATIALRAAIAHPDRVAAMALISVEDREVDA